MMYPPKICSGPACVHRTQHRKGAAVSPYGQTEQAYLRSETKKRQNTPLIACVYFTKQPEESQPMRTPCGGSLEIQIYGYIRTLII